MLNVASEPRLSSQARSTTTANETIACLPLSRYVSLAFQIRFWQGKLAPPHHVGKKGNAMPCHLDTTCLPRTGEKMMKVPSGGWAWLGMAGHGWAWLGYQALTLSSPLSASKRPCGVMAATKLDQLSKTSNRSAMVGHSTMLHISLWHLGAKLRSISGVTPYLRPLHWENS